MSRLIHCPRCQISVVYSSESPFRPFCSERCRLMDLGQWADEAYRISEPLWSDQEGPSSMKSNEENDSEESDTQSLT